MLVGLHLAESVGQNGVISDMLLSVNINTPGSTATPNGHLTSII